MIFLSAVQECESDKELSEKLYERYSDEAVITKFRVLNKQLSMKQENSIKIGDHVSVLYAQLLRLFATDPAQMMKWRWF